MFSKNKLLNPKVAGVASALLVLLAGFALLHLNSRLSLSLRFASYDWAYDLSFLKLRAPAVSEVVMVYVDEASSLDFKQPFNRPWDRAIHARLLDRLTAEARGRSSSTSSSAIPARMRRPTRCSPTRSAGMAA